jgi:hypothetical protein
MMTRILLPAAAALLVVTCCSATFGEQKQPLQRNSLDDWGMGFSDCLERHTNGCRDFAAAYQAKSGGNPATLEYVLGIESPLQKVFKDKFMFHGRHEPEIRLAAARNEYEAVQVCIIPVGTEKTLENVRLAVSDLKSPGSTIPQTQVEISVVEYVQPEPVDYPVIYKGPWPDPLIPQGEMAVSVPPLELRPFWVEVFVPRDAPPGLYQGTLQVTAGNSHELTVPVRLTVWDFEMPSERHIPTGTHLRHGVFTVSGSPEEEDAALRRYVECFLRHRIDVGPACPVPMPDDPKYEKLDKELEWAIGKGIRTLDLGFNSADSQQRKAFVELCSHLREKGWLKYARIQVGIDEPNIEHYPKVVEHAKDIKGLVPDLKTWVTESPHPALIGSVDVFGSDPCTERAEWNKAAKMAGEQVLYSLCHIPVRAQSLRPQHQAPNMILDVPGVFHRVVFWLAWSNGIDGISFWGGNCEWPKDFAKTWPEKPIPLKWPGDPTYSGIHNGNGIIVYPGKNGTPWPSLRMKMIRDGSEDFEVLWLLREAAKRGEGKRPRAKGLPKDLEPLLNPVPDICVSPTYFNPMPEPILDRRMKLGEALDTLNRSRRNR